MTDTLASYSLLAVYTAIVVYALAFILFTVDLGRRSSEATRAADERAARAGAQAEQSAAGGVAVLERTETDASSPVRLGRLPKLVRIGLALTWLAWLVHLAGTVMRGIAAERVPWANMFEFSLSATAVITGVFLLAQFWKDLSYLGAIITGLVTAWLGVAAVGFYVDVSPLQDALNSVWLVIHIVVAVLAVGFFALGAGLSALQLVRARRERRAMGVGSGFLAQIPSAGVLEDLAYRLNIVGFVFWTFTLIAGAVWADQAWGRYWGWDTKEVWTFVIWVLYAGYIHARATRGWRGDRAAWLAIIGFVAVVFNFTIVNLFFKGLHAYSGL